MAVNSRNTTLNSTKLMRRLVKLSEEQLSGKKPIDESGTDTTALPPSTDATRQLGADMASTGKEGRPAPVGGAPSEKSAAQIATPIDPNGEDRPVQDQAMRGKSGQTLGMEIPGDSKPNPAGPATPTMAPGTDTSVGKDAEIAKAKAKSGHGLALESATPEEVLNFLREHFGSSEALAFALAADGAPFAIAEALANGEVVLSDVDSRIVERLTVIAKGLIEGDDDLLQGTDPYDVIEALCTEGLADTVKAAVQRVIGGGKPGKGASAAKEANEKRTARKLGESADSRRSLLIIEGDHKVTFGTLTPSGELTNVRMIKQSDIGKCPHVIMVPEHYRDDGSCRCNDPKHTEMKEWGYKWKGGRWAA